ncbi:MAG: alpha/beta hydrolase [Myxococcota bacterium]
MSVRRFVLWVVIAVALVLAGLPTALDLLGLGPDPSAMPPRGRTQPLANGRAIHFREFGADALRPPVVLVHGLPSFASDWYETPDALARRGRRAIAYDRVGYGFSSRANPAEAGTYTLASNADDLAALLDVLGIERASLVGWSYGGGVVQTFALAHPERVHRLVLVGSIGPATPSERDNPLGVAGALLGSPLGEPLLHWIARVPPLGRAVANGGLAVAFSRAEAIPRGWADYTIAMLARPGTLAAYRAEMTRMDTSGLDVERIEVPTLVLHGNDDRLVPYSVAEDLAARIPSAKLVPVFEGSHMLPVTHPEQLADEIDRFLGI